MRSAVVLGLVAASSALAPGAHRNTLAFAGPALPLVQSHVLSSQRSPALRQPRAASLKMVDAVLLQGALAAAAGLGVAVGGIYFIETKAAKENLTDKQYNEFAMDGSDAENKFSGSDQTLDDLINAMEVAQDPDAKAKADAAKAAAPAKPKEAEDDGW
eukprot:CAMPEP_0179419698 /NCGR_PEP_ID=MMETSP0799-20121207/8747_1 /TAXON_ID=46947 /ORGANISM="Geminigera cryophila, Strain CCMP2564" /LENGTH=157 /DNA_ID=CAMNT_0021193207 /DNA_START=21 /DNA_END=494 /DNA_ORIENTATION=+